MNNISLPPRSDQFVLEIFQILRDPAFLNIKTSVRSTTRPQAMPQEKKLEINLHVT